MKILYAGLILLFTYGTAMCAQQSDIHLRYRSERPQLAPVVTPDEIRQLAAQGATLDAIKERINLLEIHVGTIQTTLDKDVLPTVHQMDFVKWVGALIFGCILLAFVNRWLKDNKVSSAT
jgi:hypothetical protein